MAGTQRLFYSISPHVIDRGGVKGAYSQEKGSLPVRVVWLQSGQVGL